jgi:hypothetical protein
MTDVSALYDEDFVAWSKQQADALRSAARTGSNHLLDWENLAEEIEDLSKRERQDLASRISTIIEHLIKLGHSPADEPRNGWRQTVRRSRLEIQRILEASPSLRREVPNLATKEARGAVELAMEDMDSRGELSPALQQALKAKSYLDLFSYTPDQILDDWFPPEPEV